MERKNLDRMIDDAIDRTGQAVEAAMAEILAGRDADISAARKSHADALAWSLKVRGY